MAMAFELSGHYRRPTISLNGKCQTASRYFNMSIRNIWLAYEDDCMIFGDMLMETYGQVALTCIGNGVELVTEKA